MKGPGDVSEKPTSVRQKKPLKKPSQRLVEAIKATVTKAGYEWSNDLERDVPRKWKTFGNLVFFRESSCFTDAIWPKIGFDILWPLVASILGVSRVAIYRGVKSDNFRSPDVKLVWHQTNDGECWVTKRENGINYSFDATKSMFSLGNFSEKTRLADLALSEPISSNGDVAVDLFAGIGYFSLSLLVKSRLKKLYCCEWNPAAVDALKRNLRDNGVDDPERVSVLEGDCRQVAPAGVAQRVYLGLIPSSELAWPTACRALSPQTGGVLHVHAVVDYNSGNSETGSRVSQASIEEAEANACVQKIADLLTVCHPVRKWVVSCSYISNVKFYGPLLRHVVFDVHCKPSL